ncbi:MAG: hypothetical protein KF718_16015 [Polyangiaceae bacterium]|nr:hypothetical protein [Polyangiaceae bacterium]
MNRPLSFLFASGVALALAGCPIYPEEPYGCVSHSDCGPGRQCDSTSGVCFLPKGGTGGQSGAQTCSAPSDCGVNETCSKTGQCRIGDCSFHGCVAGYSCEVVGGAFTCAPSGSGGAGGAGGSAGSAGAGGVAGGAGQAGSGGQAGSAGTGGAAGSSGSAGAGGSSGASSDAGQAGADASVPDAG